VVVGSQRRVAIWWPVTSIDKHVCNESGARTRVSVERESWWVESISLVYGGKRELVGGINQIPNQRDLPV
jgi:hypothetical protein